MIYLTCYSCGLAITPDKGGQDTHYISFEHNKVGKKGNPSVSISRIYFHISCFEEVAGDRYSTALKTEESVYLLDEEERLLIYNQIGNLPFERKINDC